MGRLSGRALAPRLQPFAPRLKRLTDYHGHALDEGWRAWYHTKRWARLRLKVFARDGYVCQRSGVACVGHHPAQNSPVANHKRPHRGDPALFWDEANLETVTKQVHDSLIQAEERALPRG